MTKQATEKGRLLRLGIPLMLAWSLAWLLGISILANVALNLREDMRSADLDAELALHATAIYGLTWFDEQEQFHDEVFRLETDRFNPAIDIRVLEPGNPDKNYITPAQLQFKISNFEHLNRPIMAQEEPVFLDGIDENGRPYRLHAIPTYLDQSGVNSPKAMIVVIADPEPGLAAKRAFTEKIIWTAITLGGLGLLVGIGLTRWSLRPALDSLHQRERFIAATAHELRTPLAALRSINESALKGDEEPKITLQRMQGMLESASHTVDDLLLFARLDAGAGLERQSVRLDLLVESLLPEDGSILLEAEECIAELDPRLANVAVRNLIDNARKHAGAAVISVRVHDARVEVSDNGKGFPKALLERRERDFTLSPTTTGSGLGLAISNLVARLHGGGLTLKNRPEGGALATLSFA